MNRWVFVLPLALGCSSEPGPLPDAGRPDAAQLDLGLGDGGGSGACPGAEHAPEATLAVTELGTVRGVEHEGVVRFLGIPYAQPPVAQRRWRVPEETGCFGSELDASEASSVCPQYEEGQVVGSEDCLGLNIWTPAVGAGARPVLVFVHGGGHEQGSGTHRVYDGRQLASDHDVVVVTFNYRLGPLGFLAHPDLPPPHGAYGFADQVAALRWVKTHVSAFGGDPERVLVFGESAGAASVCRLLVSPRARGLFSAVAMQSGGCSATPLAVAEQFGRGFAEGIGCTDEACLREASVDALMAGFDPLGSGTNVVGGGTWGSVVDGDYLSSTPLESMQRGEQAPVPVIIGTNREENGLDAPPLSTEMAFRAAVRAQFGFIYGEAQLERILEAYPVEDYTSPRAAYVALTSDRRFTCPNRYFARQLVQSGSSVYRYLFAQIPERSGAQLREAGAFHGLELTYLFGTLLQTPALIGPSDREVIGGMQRAWVGLAEEGAPPNGWPLYDPTSDTILLFEDGVGPAVDPKAELCNLWESL